MAAAGKPAAGDYVQRFPTYSFSSTMKKMLKDRSKLQDDSSRLQLDARFIHLAIDNLRMHLKKHGPSLRKGMDTNPTKGFYIIRNALWHTFPELIGWRLTIYLVGLDNFLPKGQSDWPF